MWENLLASFLVEQGNNKLISIFLNNLDFVENEFEEKIICAYINMKVE